jgi:hypothetical protein
MTKSDAAGIRTWTALQRKFAARAAWELLKNEYMRWGRPVRGFCGDFATADHRRSISERARKARDRSAKSAGGGSRGPGERENEAQVVMRRPGRK